MQKMTEKERIDLGSHLAKTQTLVIRAFRTRNQSAAGLIANDIFNSLTQSNMPQRLQIIEGTELCITLLGERYRDTSKEEASAMQLEHIERTLHDAVTSAIDMMAAYDRKTSMYYKKPSFVS